jgi:hypothetical protein
MLRHHSHPFKPTRLERSPAPTLRLWQRLKIGRLLLDMEQEDERSYDSVEALNNVWK